jgi:hypothetical protein
VRRKFCRLFNNVAPPIAQNPAATGVMFVVCVCYFPQVEGPTGGLDLRSVVPRALDLKVGALEGACAPPGRTTVTAGIQAVHNEHPRYGLSDSRAVR